MVGEKFVWVRCRGILLTLWSSRCFEFIGSLVGSLVEVDDATITREVVEFARLRVKIPVGRDAKMVKQVQINGTLCTVSFEEEFEIPLAMQRFYDHHWGVAREEGSEASLDEFGGVGSVNCFYSELGEGFELKEGEDKTIHFPAEVKGSLFGGEGGACKNNHCGKKPSLGGVGAACNPNNCGVNLSSLGQNFPILVIQQFYLKS